MENANIRADMVEAIEFPHLVNQYHVQGVPRTVINDKAHLEGAAPEPLLVAKLLEALGIASQQPAQAPTKARDKAPAKKGTRPRKPKA